MSAEEQKVMEDELAALATADLSSVAPERSWTFHRIQDGYANGIPRAVFVSPNYDDPVGIPLVRNVAVIMGLAQRLAREVASLRAEVKRITVEGFAAHDEALDKITATIGRFFPSIGPFPALENAADRLADGIAVGANLEALREKARAVGTVADERFLWFDEIGALTAELDKPSGSNLVARLEAWKALAKAWNEQDEADAFTGDPAGAAQKKLAAIAALRALGEDPEAP